MQPRAFTPRGRRTISGSALLLLSVLVASLLILASTILAFASANTDAPNANDIRISQVYGGGGATSGSPSYKCDYIELFNAGTTAVSLNGWSVQYGSATGTGNWLVDTLALTLTVQPNKYVLIQEGCGTLGADLPPVDDTGALSMSATNGKVALVNNTTALNGACPSAGIVDKVGYGSANCYEGSAAAPVLSNTTAALRGNGGCTDTDNNSADFTAGTPSPRNSGSPTNSCGPDTTPPTVLSTIPISNATNVLLNSTVQVTFSEPVSNVTTSTLTVVSAGGPVTGAISGTGANRTFTPSALLAPTTLYTATLTTGITDLSNNALASNYVWSFTTGSVSVCGASATLISAIQGSGAASPLVGTTQTIEGVVKGDFQSTTTELSGFFVQEEDSESDGNPATSEGIFVYDNGFGVDVSVGQVVRVTGTVAEFNNLTELNLISAVSPCPGSPTATPSIVTLPVSSPSDLEQYEGMAIQLPAALYVTEHYDLGRYGQVALSVSDRLYQPTALVLPGGPGSPRDLLQNLNDRSRIWLDDGNLQQNRDPIVYPPPALSASNTLRTGDTVTGLTGVLFYYAAQYMIEPVAPVSVTHSNPRTAAPSAVGGNVSVASFNVLNYFNGDGLGGGFPTPRGANTLAEFNRQRAKTISAIVGLNADVIGLMELENDGYGATSAIQDLVNGLNAATAPGTFAFINPGGSTFGGDEITVGIIYRPAKATPVGAAVTLNTGAFDQSPAVRRNRQPMVQTFADTTFGEKFTVVVNHLKSKGSACDTAAGVFPPDPDTGDGQGNCNITRTMAANELTAWLGTDPTGSGDRDFIIIGDLNSYTKEDPITAIKSAGYVNLVENTIGVHAYSYVFDGQSGYLDHALASAPMAATIAGVAEWHINADEPRSLDYNVEFKSPGQVISLYAPDAYRSSDHDPVLVGIKACAWYDTNCSCGGASNVADIIFTANDWGKTSGFAPRNDVAGGGGSYPSPDGMVNILDVQAVAGRFAGATCP
ncbi:ExeM/NucH family extracellular endonuclease [Candidatus Amarolinea aalborgensis]|uniref:ExeM/NucH family extracellular endonuclease n=1 Tax=Candidatus Amarolinea aalborgensis TaxID=2249329 RepID=UPI003BFA358C